MPVGEHRVGFQAGADLSGVNFIPADNSDIAAGDINDVEYAGGRISARWDISDNWRLLLAHTSQDTEADGVFFADPEVGDLEISRFVDERIDDTFDNTAWTLTGVFDALDVIYTGAFTDRLSEQIIDYTDYLFVGQYLPYYICDGAVTYPDMADPAGTCNEPQLFVDSLNDLQVRTHEIRFTTDPSNRWRLQGGVFSSELELIEVNDFTYPGSVRAIASNGVAGSAPNYPLTNTAVTGRVGAAGEGYYTYSGPFGDGIIFRNDVRRTDDQFGVFGELGGDLGERHSLTVGARNWTTSNGCRRRWPRSST